MGFQEVLKNLQSGDSLYVQVSDIEHAFEQLKPLTMTFVQALTAWAISPDEDWEEFALKKLAEILKANPNNEDQEILAAIKSSSNPVSRELKQKYLDKVLVFLKKGSSLVSDAHTKFSHVQSS
jgi:hypothetical protein